MRLFFPPPLSTQYSCVDGYQLHLIELNPTCDLIIDKLLLFVFDTGRIWTLNLLLSYYIKATLTTSKVLLRCLAVISFHHSIVDAIFCYLLAPHKLLFTCIKLSWGTLQEYHIIIWSKRAITFWLDEEEAFWKGTTSLC